MLRQLRPIGWNENMPVHAPPLDCSGGCFRYPNCACNFLSKIDLSSIVPPPHPTLARSLDYFVRSRLHDQRDGDVESLGGLEIDDQLELHRLAHRYLSGICAF